MLNSASGPLMRRYLRGVGRISEYFLLYNTKLEMMVEVRMKRTTGTAHGNHATFTRAKSTSLDIWTAASYPSWHLEIVQLLSFSRMDCPRDRQPSIV